MHFIKIAHLNPDTLEINAKNAYTIKIEGNNQSSFAPTSNEGVLTKGVYYRDEVWNILNC